MRRFQPLISGVVIKLMCRRGKINLALADDLVQDTYLKICAHNFKALRDFDFRHENALFGFLKVVTANVVEDYYRTINSQKRGQGRGEDDLEYASAVTPMPASDPMPVERQILIGEIAQCLQQQAAEPNFSRDYAIFWLYYRQGLTAKAIAGLPGISLSVKGVESTLLRLTRLVRTQLAPSAAKKRVTG
ncbi:MAG TPA: sigma-70 family RNA polymerase sigma factor [Candidatus Angelobacter sp.]|nr:sigma-70 family RNA polymerase sigma factor [Candidatus Angelobacter sp.]